ncbi:MAG: 50S ribosomal protein L9 [Verrucomicrobia bacterium]|nr:50S ribosomal protein L9 [Verrucomicrobiota bacterium]
MAKVEVILIHPIVGLGAESDQVKVAAGFARNYLLPQGLAIPLTQSNKRRLEALRQRRAERESHELNAMTELAKSLGKMTLTIAVKTGDDGRMFGSVTNGTIADELKKQFEVSLDKRKIHIEKPIKGVGEHEVEMRLHQGVHTMLKVVINSSNPLPTTEPAPSATAPVTEKRGKHRAAEVAAPAAEAKPERKGKTTKG